MTVAFFRRILLHRWRRLTRNVRKRSTKLTEELPELEISEKTAFHTPVMIQEVVENLNLKDGNMFLDMTFGSGGHSEALLKKTPTLRVFALDRDPTAQGFAEELEKKYPGQITFLEGKFSDLPQLLNNYEVKHNSFDGILFDLGCSSMQLDNAERGFSILRNGPLDMRMDGGKAKGELTAADVVAYATEKELMQIFKTYGGEVKALKVARAIVQARTKFKPLNTTRDLSDLVEIVFEGKTRFDKLGRKTSAATKVFQALRIFINNEINELNYGVLLANKYLKPMGRAAVLTFHSVEDLIVKRHFRNQPVDNTNPPLSLSFYNSFKDYKKDEISQFTVLNWQQINKKVLVPSKDEIMTNPRSRSVKLRVAAKLTDSQN